METKAMSQLTPEGLRARENALGPDKMREAMDIAVALGWRPGMDPPMYVWHGIYSYLENPSPERAKALGIPIFTGL